MKICGIYCILNLLNNKRYIGRSVNVKSRWSGHKSDLRKGKHHSFHLQNAWTKYGESSFKFTLVEECSEKDLNYCENKWLSLYKPYYRSNGYNLDMESKRLSTETRLKQSASAKANPNLVNKVRHASSFNIHRRMCQYTTNLVLIKIWKSSGEAERCFGLYKSTIIKSIKRKVLVRGFVWAYEGDVPVKVINQHKRKVIGRNSESTIVFNSLVDAAKYCNATVKNIWNCVKGKRKEFKGFKWSYYND